MIQKYLRKKWLLTVVLCLNLIYMLWRVFFTVPLEQGALSFFFAGGLLLAEMLGLFELCVTIDGLRHMSVPPLPQVGDDDFCEVDVFVATYNEEVSLVRKTLLGCQNMHYPKKEKVQIYLCDDGNRPTMQVLARELGVHYLARSERNGAKAGNLNHALAHSSAPLVVTFDADMIPMEQFLMQTVPYFLVNRSAGMAVNQLGFVQTPQSFYNADLFQTRFFAEKRIPNEQDYFYRQIQATKNHGNSVIYGGSNTVLSREALAAIGGFYEKSITEDFATGILMQAKGYRCYASKTVLASGLSPTDTKSLFNQRARWARGCIQTIRQMNVLRTKGLRWRQRVSYLSAISYWYSCVKRFFYIAAPIAYAVFGITVLHCSWQMVMLVFLPCYLLTNIVLSAHARHLRATRWTNVYETIFFPSLCKAVLLESVGVSQKKFSVTDKSGVTQQDTRYHRQKAAPFWVLIVLSVVGIFNIVWHGLPSSTQPLALVVVLVWLVANLGTLCMALLFVSGNKVEQRAPAVRYDAAVRLILTQGGLSWRGESAEIFENGFAVSVNQPLPFAAGEEVQVNVSVQGIWKAYRCQFAANFQQTQQAEQEVEGYRAVFEMVEVSEKDRDVWHVVLHNRLPSMPERMEGTRSLWGDVLYTLRCRFGKLTEHVS